MPHIFGTADFDLRSYLQTGYPITQSYVKLSGNLNAAGGCSLLKPNVQP
jgi:hypothetical protein